MGLSAWVKGTTSTLGIGWHNNYSPLPLTHRVSDSMPWASSLLSGYPGVGNRVVFLVVANIIEYPLSAKLLHNACHTCLI